MLCTAAVVSTALAANPQVDVQTSLGRIRLELYPTAAPKTVEERLQTLEDLKKKGLITDDEYKRKRQEILKDL